MHFAEIFNEVWLTAMFRLALTAAVVTLMGVFIYLPRRQGNRDYLFTYISSAMIVFIVCVMLSKVPVELGLALGLFAVFSIIRFRSIQATPRELSYLLIALGLAIMNALSFLETPYIRLIVNNLVVLLLIWLADYVLFRNPRVEKVITYDRLELLEEGRRKEMEADLRTRFGITNIRKIQVGNIDVHKGRVKLKVEINDRKEAHFQDK
jgi:hypothetical protein